MCLSAQCVNSVSEKMDEDLNNLNFDEMMDLLLDVTKVNI